LSHPFLPRNSSSGPFVRVNGKIRAREVRVIGLDGRQLGVLALGEALTLARNNGVDLVEIAPNATPPVCRVVDFGKYRYEQAKREKESKKHQHATRLKEVQLSPKIDPHDLSVKIEHAVGFLCDENKVKVTLKFRGREMAHTEYGFQVVQKFLAQTFPYGRQDFEPKLIGRSINVTITPLPRNKRARNPYQPEAGSAPAAVQPAEPNRQEEYQRAVAQMESPTHSEPAERKPGVFANSPFAQLDIK